MSRRREAPLFARQERGLPQHPAWDWVHCDACDGGGEVVLNDTNPHGYGPDPQCDEPVTCEVCGGKGEVWDAPRPVEVLMDLHRFRRFRWFGANSLLYAHTRARAMRRVPLPGRRA